MASLRKARKPAYGETGQPCSAFDQDLTSYQASQVIADLLEKARPAERPGDIERLMAPRAKINEGRQPNCPYCGAPLESGQTQENDLVWYWNEKNTGYQCKKWGFQV